MSIFKALLGILKAVLPFLRSAAEKAFKKLPKEKQEQLIKISQMVEVIKQMRGDSFESVVNKINEVTGIANIDIFVCLMGYLTQKGVEVKQGITLHELIVVIWNDAEKRTETGLKSLWSGISNIVSSVVAEIDWELLLMGVGEFVYRNFVKGKVKI